MSKIYMYNFVRLLTIQFTYIILTKNGHYVLFIHYSMHFLRKPHFLSNLIKHNFYKKKVQGGTPENFVKILKLPNLMKMCL